MPDIINAGVNNIKAGDISPAFMLLFSNELLSLRAASNVIIVQNAERRGQTLTFPEFARAGVPLTIINIIVYRIFLSLM